MQRVSAVALITPTPSGLPSRNRAFIVGAATLDSEEKPMKPRLLAAVLAALAGVVLLLPHLTAGEPASIGQSATGGLDFHLPAFATPAMAQGHGLLIDRHTAAGVNCQACHGGAAFTEPVAMQVCTDCHGSYAELAAMTPWEPNPHHSHMGEVECSVCHNIHKPSVSFCDQCHSFGMQVP